tara:strand:- start:8298 stop:8810 length:513 start_codon:yes stop_codon:yes gene_type:complete
MKNLLHTFFAVILLQSCASTPYLKTNAVDTFDLSPNTEFRLSFDSDFLPAKVDPIAADLIKRAVANNLESKGHTMTEDAPILVKLTISNEEKIQNDTNFYSYPYYYRYPYPYDYDRIRLIDEYYLRVSIFDSENDQTLWTGLTRWRQNSKFEPSNDISAQNLVDLILDSI